MRTLSIFLIIAAFCTCTNSQDQHLSQWRGPARDGKFQATGLMAEWPAEGPRLIWYYEGLGEGHGNVGVGADRYFVCSMIDSTGYLHAFGFDGELLWKVAYGQEWFLNYTGARSTPIVVGDMVYFESGQGVVYCYNGNTGALVWSVDLLGKFDAENIRWGMAESLLVDGDKIYCTPGGKEHNVVALNRHTGETIWTSTGNRQPAAYCSPILVEHNGTRLIVTMTASSIIGVDAETGRSYWAVEHRQGNKIHANTPVYDDGQVLCSSSSDKSDLDGTVLLRLAENGKHAEVVWRNTDFTNLMGGVILNDGFIYGSRYRSSEWYCLNWQTGEIEYTHEGLRNGAIVYADGLYYCYTEKGEMVLVNANQNSFEIISQFDVPYGTMQHWAHPVIHDGRLIIRHGNALMVYDIKKPAG